MKSDVQDENYLTIQEAPLMLDDLKYFIVYPDCTEGECPIFTSTRCARINIYSPEYVRCTDSGKDEWVLNYEEKKILCQYLNDNQHWKHLLECYEAALEYLVKI